MIPQIHQNWQNATSPSKKPPGLRSTLRALELIGKVGGTFELQCRKTLLRLSCFTVKVFFSHMAPDFLARHGLEGSFCFHMNERYCGDL